ncbi:MAG: DUF1501 domain-containing protein [Acidimicrobiia bacterium]|nr:DUF1501 domain-containing protein [Acidimicrobiia bacterium]
MRTRRIFLRESALAVAGIGAAPLWLTRAAGAATSRNKILVAIFQRGAADALNMLVPFRENRYYQLRPTLAVPAPGKPEGALDLDGSFGLHPSLQPFHELFQRSQLAIVTACGSPDPTRSHFDAQDYMESGTPGVKSTRGGWLNRALNDDPKASPIRAVAMGPRLPRALRGASSAVAVGNLRDFNLRSQEASGMLESMYSRSEDQELAGAGKDTFDAIKLIESINRRRYTPANAAAYPRGRLGPSLEQIARLIKADAGLQVAFADTGGWDHHVNEANILPNMLREFSQSIAAFAADLGDRMEDIVLVTMSEFGRAAHENGNRGTDHGHGGVMFALGGAVKGGKIHGRWPGLEKEQLFEGRDLAVTTDFRQVLGELISGHLGHSGLSDVFPGFAFTPGGLGMLA